MSNCSNCGVKIGFLNRPTFGQGKQKDGTEICFKCFSANLKNKNFNTIPENKIEKVKEIEIVDLELNTMQKLQYKKFISEQSGMNLQEVESYLETVSESEKEELIKNFKNQNVKKSEATVIPTIQIIKDDSDKPSCPKCNSKQVTYNKQGFGFGKALVGGVLTGGIGLLAGGINKNKIILTCLKCGKTWKP